MLSSTSSNVSDTPSEALIELLSPDGYYTYLGVKKPAPSASEHGAAPLSTTPSSSANAADDPSLSIDADEVKKKYRRLSLIHHPDRRGDADTFRMLNRAQKVLTNPKLRQQYDILGIDLDDDEVEHDDDDGHGGAAGEDGGGKGEQPSSTQGIVQEIASTVLTGVIQLGVRTLMMGAVSVILVRYWLLLYPALAFLAYVFYGIFRQYPQVPGGSIYDTLPPTLIATGLCVMYTACKDCEGGWNKQFWLGEALVIGMFCYNSLGTTVLQQNKIVMVATAIFSLLAALGFRGKFWNYAIVVVLIAIVALLLAVAFPIIELLLEAILNEKLKKVGQKIRHHHEILQKHYEQKAK